MRYLYATLLALLSLAQQPGFFGSNFNSGPPAPAYSSTASCTNAITGTSVNCSMTGAGGEVTFIFVIPNNQTSVPTASDSAGGTIHNVYTDGGQTSPQLWATRSVYIFAIYNLSAGAHTITVNMSTSIGVTIGVSSYTGASTTAPITAVNALAAYNPITNPFSCNPITTTTLNSTIVSIAGTSAAAGSSTATGFLTKRYAFTSFPQYSAGDGATSTPSSYTATWASGSTTLPGFCSAVVIR